jgi:CheY-like chemotaxis protein
MTKCMVLVVEDDPALRDLVRRQLGKLGFDSVQVESGEAALEFDRTNVGLIFMDIGLPGMDGIYTTMLIREKELNEGRKRVPIVALTGHAERERVMTKAVGMDDFLQKPALMDDLKRVLDKWFLEICP